MLTRDEYEILKKYLALAEEPGGLDRPIRPSETMVRLVEKGYMSSITRPNQLDPGEEVVVGHFVTEEGKKAREMYESRLEKPSGTS